MARGNSAYSSTNIDRVRHFAVSIRELLTHIFHILGPDEEIAKWTTDSQMYHNGKPTRKARLLFICRNITNKPLTQFVEKDTAATLAFIDLFQQGTHEIVPNFTEKQLVAIKSKAESTIRFLIEIELSTNR